MYTVLALQRLTVDSSLSPNTCLSHPSDGCQGRGEENLAAVLARRRSQQLLRCAASDALEHSLLTPRFEPAHCDIESQWARAVSTHARSSPSPPFPARAVPLLLLPPDCCPRC